MPLRTQSLQNPMDGYGVNHVEVFKKVKFVESSCMTSKVALKETESKQGRKEPAMVTNQEIPF